MKKLIFLFLSILTAGSFFQACDNSKTYAEMLEDEKNAVNDFISDSAIHVISEDQFRQQAYTTKAKANGDEYDEYVFFSADGVYMQVIRSGTRGEAELDEEGNQETDENGVPSYTGGFKNNNNITVRYTETDIATRSLTCFNVPLDEYIEAHDLYAYPAVFRYVKNSSSSSYYSASTYGTFIEMDYYWSSMYGTTAVPAGWLLALPYVYDGAHVRLIVPSKMGHSSAQQYVAPYFYDLRELRKEK